MIFFITGSSDNSPAFSVDEPLKVFELSNDLALFTESIKDCKFTVACDVSTVPFSTAGVSTLFTVVDECKFKV